WSLAVTPAPLMRTNLIVFLQPQVQIALQLFGVWVNLAPKGHPVKFIKHGAMEALDDPVGLGTFDLSATVVDVLHRQVQLVFVVFGVHRSTPCRDRSTLAAKSRPPHRRTGSPGH